MTDYTPEGRAERLQQFKENRDPVLNSIYHSVEKTRKWVVFLGIMVIISMAIGFLNWVFS